MRDLPKRPTLAELRILRVMVEEDAKLIQSSRYSGTGGSDSMTMLYPDGIRKSHAGTFKDPDVERLSSDSWYKLVRRGFVADEINETFNSQYAATDKGRAAWEKYRSILEKADAKQAEKDANARRLVVVSSKGRWSSEKRTYAGLFRVVRETDKRLYVEGVKMAGTVSDWQTPVEGRPGGQYVSRDDVVLDGVTEEKFDRLVAFENSKFAHYADLKRQEEDELEPIRKRYADRREQAEAMFDDELREIIG